MCVCVYHSVLAEAHLCVCVCVCNQTCTHRQTDCWEEKESLRECVCDKERGESERDRERERARERKITSDLDPALPHSRFTNSTESLLFGVPPLRALPLASSSSSSSSLALADIREEGHDVVFERAHAAAAETRTVFLFVARLSGVGVSGWV